MTARPGRAWSQDRPSAIEYRSALAVRGCGALSRGLTGLAGCCIMAVGLNFTARLEEASGAAEPPTGLDGRSCIVKKGASTVRLAPGAGMGRGRLFGHTPKTSNYDAAPELLNAAKLPHVRRTCISRHVEHQGGRAYACRGFRGFILEGDTVSGARTCLK